MTFTAVIVDLKMHRGRRRLQLNSSKIKVLRYATSCRRHQLPSSALSVDSVMIDPMRSVRDLDAFIDADLVMRSHVQRTMSQCFAILRQILVAASHSPNTGCCPRSVSTGLRRRLKAVLIEHLRRSDHITTRSSVSTGCVSRSESSIRLPC